MPPLELILDVLLYSVGPAALVAAALTASGSCCPRGHSVGAALGVALGVAAGMWTRTGVEMLSSSDWSGLELARSLPESLALIAGASAWNRLPYLAFAALLLGVLVRMWEAPMGLAMLARAAAAIGIAWCVVPTAYQAENHWLVPALAAAIFAEWALVEPLADRAPGGVGLALALSALVAAGVLIHAGSARLTDAALALGGALAGVALAAGCLRSRAGGAVPGVAVCLPGLLLMGQQETFSEISWWAFALAATAPLMLVFTWPLHWRSGALAVRPEATSAATASITVPAKAGVSRRVLLVLVHLAVMLPPWLAAMYLARAAGPLEFE